MWIQGVGAQPSSLLALTWWAETSVCPDEGWNPLSWICSDDGAIPQIVIPCQALIGSAGMDERGCVHVCASVRVCSLSACLLNTAACLFLCASRCVLAWVQTTCGWKLDPQFSPAASSYLDFVLPRTLLVSQNILLLCGSDERARKLSKLTFKLSYCFIDSILAWLLAETLSP